MKITINVPVVYIIYGAGRNNFDAGNIQYKDHQKGRRVPEVEAFQGPEMATSD